MALTVRQRIMDEIAARFATITTGNSYQTDIGQNITEWSAVPITDRHNRGIDLTDPLDEYANTAPSPNCEDHTLNVYAVIHCKEAGDTADYLRKAICDVYRAIGNDRYWTVSGDRLARNGTFPVQDEITVDQAGKITGAARVHFQVKYRTATLDPLTLK